MSVSDSTYDRMAETFSKMEIRMPFLRKVYGIQSIQLLIILGLYCTFVLVDEVREFILKTPAPFWTAIGLTLTMAIVLSCCGDILRKFPQNYIALFIFTLCEACLFATGSGTITMGVGIIVTLQIYWMLTLFTLQSKYNFNGITGFLIVLLDSLVMFGCLMRFGILSDQLPQGYIEHMGFASLGAFLFGVYIVVITQLILEGKYKTVLSPDEYVFAALILHLALVKLFVTACKNGCKAVLI